MLQEPQITADRATGTPSGLLPERLAHRLRMMIATEELAPGGRIREREIAERLSVSRTPLRDALKILAGDGLVVLLPNRGAVVARVSIVEIEDRLALMSVLEGYAGQRAAERVRPGALSEIRAAHFEMRAAYERADRSSYFRLNQKIHQAIVDAAESPALREAHDRLNRQLFPYRFNGSLTPDIWATAMEEHEAITRLLTERNGPELARVLSLHVGSTWRAMRAGTAPG